VPSEPHALVTGTSSGIGRAIAERLLEEGWKVTGLDIATATISHAGFVAVRVDLTDAAAAEAAARSAGEVQAFVHAAGLMRGGTAGELDAAEGEIMWRLHVQAAACIGNALLPVMSNAGHGRVVFVGSRVSAGLPGRSQYAASKAALVAMARSWAAEVVSKGVTVNVVSPAATETADAGDPGRAAVTPRVPPIGRLIQPGEIAALVSYLLSDNAAAITGQDIAICGGASLPR
jgi:NAD(P)-dependent dehydrogenase (short-subunit alcohol dehydrogenase family)